MPSPSALSSLPPFCEEFKQDHALERRVLALRSALQTWGVGRLTQPLVGDSGGLAGVGVRERLGEPQGRYEAQALGPGCTRTGVGLREERTQVLLRRLQDSGGPHTDLG